MIWMSSSPNLRHWANSRHILATGEIPSANSKMGPGAPPVRTRKGWLTTFHAVWRDDTRGKNGWEKKWPKVYLAGLMLMDLGNPWRIIGICEIPLMVPTAWMCPTESLTTRSARTSFFPAVCCWRMTAR